MNGAAEITEVQLFATHDAFSEGLFFNNEIVLCHTTVSELTTSFAANYAGNDPYSVFLLDTLAIDWTAPGWNGLVFDRPFDYNGTDNLIIEFRYLGENGKTINARAFYPPTPNRTLDAGLPTSPTGQLLSFMNSMRIYYTPETGVGEPDQAPGLSVGAVSNPCASPALEISSPEACEALVEVFGIDGRIVWRGTAALDRGTNAITLPQGGPATGTYLVRVSTASASDAVRLVVID